MYPIAKLRPRPAGARGRLWTVRSRLALVAAVAITALLGLVAVNAARDWEQQRNLVNDCATGELGGEASIPLYVGAQVERKLTAVYLARPTRETRAALAKQRGQTDRAVAAFRHLSGTRLETDQRHKWEYVERIYSSLDGLADARRAVDGRGGSSEKLTGYYTGLLAKMVQFYQQLSAMDDPQLALQTRPLVGLFWAGESLAQEDMLISQARAAGEMSAEDREAFASAYGAQRVMYERWIAPYLPAKDKATYDRITGSAQWRTKQGIEKALINAPTARPDGSLGSLPADAARWDRAYGSLVQQVGALNASRTRGLIADGYARAEEIRSQVYLQVGGSLAAVAVLAVLIISIIRTIVARIRELQHHAEETAERLPTVVKRLQRGETVGLAEEFPAPADRRDEFAGLERELNAAQRTAVELASKLAGERTAFGTFVTVTSSRALNLVEGQMLLLAELEKQHEKDPAVLGDFIKVDHQAGLLRRLLDAVQTGAGGHQEPYSEDKAVADVVNEAAAESKDPQRVENLTGATEWVRRQGVGAVMHILSALMDNALVFSAGPVTVRHTRAPHGLALDIEDKGTGMRDEELAHFNELLASPPSFEDWARDHDGRLGLFAVAKLVSLYDIRVALREGDYGGIRAVVLVPNSLLCRQPEPQVDAPPPTAQQPAAPLPSRKAAHQGSAARVPLPQEEPWPKPVAAVPVPASKNADVLTDPEAPPLPKRRRGSHMASQLSGDAVQLPPAFDPAAADVDPEATGSRWGAWQRGRNRAETHHRTGVSE
jgi:signal transduction histidine kinase